MTKQQVGTIILIIIALLIFGYALIGVQVPQTNYPYTGGMDKMDLGDGKTVSFVFLENFSASGSFSAENNIHVKVTIFNSTIANLSDYIGFLYFTNSFNNPLNIVNGLPIAADLPLNKSGDQYVAEGDLIWHESTVTRLSFLPHYQGMILTNTTQTELTQPPILTISPVSDTLTWESNIVIEKLTWVLIGFTVIMLQPIISALFPDKLHRR
jgi:hypothetical protein